MTKRAWKRHGLAARLSGRISNRIRSSIARPEPVDQLTHFPRPRKKPSKGFGVDSTGDPDAGDTRVGDSVPRTRESADAFDREIEQYDLVKESITERIRDLEAKMDDCRDGGDLLVDYKRYAAQHAQAKRRLSDLAVGRAQYVADRDRLIAWGPTDERVVAGSIVTVKYLSGDMDTFVLTERPFDTEYDVVSYRSPMGLAVRRRRIGDRVSLPAGAPLVVHDVRPGFRGAPADVGRKPEAVEPQGGRVRRQPRAYRDGALGMAQETEMK